jgi:hypothetical protein
MTDPVEVGFAILFAGLLLLMLWKWFREEGPVVSR